MALELAAADAQASGLAGTVDLIIGRFRGHVQEEIIEGFRFRQAFMTRMREIVTDPARVRQVTAHLGEQLPRMARLAGGQQVLTVIRLCLTEGHTAADLASPALRKQILARAAKYVARYTILGLVFLSFILDAQLAWEVGTASFEKGREVGTTIVRERDVTLALEAQAADAEAFNSQMGLLIWAVQRGRLKLLPGVQPKDCAALLLKNLEEGRRPFVGILEPRKATRLTGPWKGSIHLKKVEGRTGVDEGNKPPPIKVTLQNFEITQDEFNLTFRFGSSKISGLLYPDGRALFTDRPQGTMTSATFRLFGPKDGGLSGKLQVEFDQADPQGGTRVYGGLLERGTEGDTPVVQLSVVVFPSSDRDYIRVRCPAFVELRAGKLTGTLYGTLVASPAADGPFDRPACSFRISGTSKIELAPDQPGEGWVGPDTYQFPAGIGTAMIRRDAAGRLTSGYEDGPAYFQATLEPSLRRDTGENVSRELWTSNVVAPEAPAIRVLNQTRDGKIVLPGNDGAIGSLHSWGELRLKLAPRNQQYGYPRARFAVTINGQTRYAFSAPVGGWGQNEAILSVPPQWEPVRQIAVRVEWRSRVVDSVTLPVLENPSGWAKLTRWRETEIARVERETKEWQTVAERVLKSREKNLADSTQALEKLRATPTATAQQRQAQARRVEGDRWNVERQRIDLKRIGQDREARLGAILNDHAKRLAAWQLALAIVEEEHALDLRRGATRKEEDYRGQVASHQGIIADMAVVAGDVTVFRAALEKGVIPWAQERMQAAGQGPSAARNAQGRARGLAVAYEDLANGLATLTGETADAKRYWLLARDVRLQHTTAAEKKQLEAAWANGKRPTWWPGD